MVGAVNYLEKQEKKQQKELFFRENGIAYGVSYNDMTFLAKPARSGGVH